MAFRVFSFYLPPGVLAAHLTNATIGGITVFNTSNKTVYGIGVYAGRTLGHPQSLALARFNDSGAYKIEPKGKNDLILSDPCMSDFLKNDPIFRIGVYYFDPETLNTTPWDTIVTHNLYLKKDSFNYQEIVNRNWRVEYP